ncbi:MAG: caspase family protein [Hyphomicrobiaceae bacterium]
MRESGVRRVLMVLGVLAGMLVFPLHVVMAANKALVVGNSAYASVDRLANPANDASDVAALLKSLGYDVTLVVDASRRTFLGRFQAFVQGLRQDDLALFYYAGHGLQIGGENYLFPVDSSIGSEADAKARLIPLNAILADLTRAVRNRIVILDACRNNPFAEAAAKGQQTRALGRTRGLARVYAGVGSFIVYSTQPGNVAYDGGGRNSPFTSALLHHAGMPGADVHKVMRLVRADVQKETHDRQVPWENSSLIDDISFAAKVQPQGAPSQPPQTTAAHRPSPSRHGAKVVQGGVRYSFVTGLDPKGDNFLALRSAPDATGVRIATMGPNTLLRVTGKRGPWRQVVLLDGARGWAHGNWIKCCRTLASVTLPSGAATPAPTAERESCADLWYRRNAIWHRHGYCFNSARGQATFGNAGCSRHQAGARAAMSKADVDLVDALTAKERELGCR